MPVQRCHGRFLAAGLSRPLALRQVLALTFYFPVLLTLSLGLSFHNRVAVIEGFLGIKPSFVRTPKYNIVGPMRTTADKAQKIPIGNSLLIEGLLAIIVAAALVMGVVVKNQGLFVFHPMLAVGFGTVFLVSLRERGRAGVRAATGCLPEPTAAERL
jgi:hypothetical protein